MLGREFKKGWQGGREEGRKEGLKEGLKEGRQEGELSLLRRQIEKRFGPIPAWADERLQQLATAELESVGLRLLDATSLEDLLQ